MNTTINKISGLFALAALAFSVSTASANTAAKSTADTYPNKPVTIIVGYPPGGATDVIARVVADHLGKSLGQPFIVKNEPGAGSNIATDAVVRAAPDGYTLLVETIANATNMSVYKNLRYDTEKDLAPIAQFMASPSILVTGPSLSAKSLTELIEKAKANPGKYSFASSGVGGSPHLAGEMLKLRAGIDILHVPYKGATPALQDVLGGSVDMGFKTSLGAMQHMESGRLQPIAVANPTRLKELPNVPTMAEAGLPDFYVLSWNGLAAPAGTPEPIIEKLNKEVNRILQLPEVRKQLESLGAEPVIRTPKEFASFVSEEIKKWGEVVRSAKIQLD
jgi:tripartite-type tricarboxylate transporter receptor subunit TctC